MAQKLLSLDIRDDIVCGLQLSVIGKAATVVGCAVAVRDEESMLAETVAEVIHHLEYTGGPCRVALGAENYFYRNLSFPFHDKRKIDKILPIELEDTIIVDMEDVLVDSLVTGKKGALSSVVAAMMDRELLRNRLDMLAELGLDPEIVTISNVQTALQLSRQQDRPSFVLLDAGCRRLTMYLMAEGRMRLIRTTVFEDGSGASFSIDKNSQQVFARRPDKIEETMALLCRDVRHTFYSLDDLDPHLPLFLTGALAEVQGVRQAIGRQLDCEVHRCELLQPSIKIGEQCGVWRGDLMTSALALGLRSGRRQVGFNFRKEEFARKASFEQYRRLAPRLGIPLALCFVVALGYLWNDYSLRQKNLQSLKEQGESIFSETIPEVTRIIDPVQQLQVEIREMKKGMLGNAALESDLKVLDLMAEISARIPQSINVHVLRMVADGNTILLRGLTDNFNSVDSVKKVLEKSSYFSTVTINSANVATQSEGIRFEMRLDLSRG